MLLLGALKIVATALTVGTGGSASNFGRSLVIGGIFGGAFGRMAQLLLHDPRIDPGAFALVGNGEFAPVASNDSPQGGTRNRRIEIVLQPNIDELVAVADVK